MSIKVMVAKFHGHCFRCGRLIKSGENIAWFTISKRTAHWFCAMNTDYRVKVPPVITKESKETGKEQRLSVSKLMLSCFHQKFEIPTKLIPEVYSIKDHVFGLWRTTRGYFPRESEYPNPRVQIGNGEIVAKMRGIFDSEEVCRNHDMIRSYLGKRNKDPVPFKYRPSNLPLYSDTPIRNLILRRGIELEGFWAGSSENTIHISHDGSVRLSSEETGKYPYLTSAGEIRTNPFPITDGNWEREFRQNYPKFSNTTCGMHVHFSFSNMGVYSGFVNRQFQPWLLSGLREWIRTGMASNSFPVTENEYHNFVNRIEGNNHYCKLQYYPGDQLNAIRSHPSRYCAVNYCYSKHKTLEVRVLPMFAHPDAGKMAIDEVTRLINIWGSKMCPNTQHGVTLHEVYDTWSV